VSRVEERELQPVEVGGHAATRSGQDAGGIGGDDRGACALELPVTDAVGRRAGEGRDLDQGVPLDGDVIRPGPESFAGIDEPGVCVGAVEAGDAPKAQVQSAEDPGIDDEPARDHQPGGEGSGLRHRVEPSRRGHRLELPTRSSLVRNVLAACSVDRPVHRPAVRIAVVYSPTRST